MENSVFTICTSRTDDHSPATVGIWVPCTGCKTDVWLSDTTVSAVKKQDPSMVDKISPYCFKCGFAEMEKMKDPKFIAPSEEQITEIVDTIKKDAEQR